MPCNSDYLKPRPAEVESRRAAKLLVYVHRSLGRISTATWIVQAAESSYGNEQRLNDLVRLLCEACQDLTDDERDRIMYNGRKAEARQLADWWESHLAADEARVSREQYIGPTLGVVVYPPSHKKNRRNGWALDWDGEQWDIDPAMDNTIDILDSLRSDLADIVEQMRNEPKEVIEKMSQ